MMSDILPSFRFGLRDSYGFDVYTFPIMMNGCQKISDEVY